MFLLKLWCKCNKNSIMNYFTKRSQTIPTYFFFIKVCLSMWFASLFKSQFNEICWSLLLLLVPWHQTLFPCLTAWWAPRTFPPPTHTHTLSCTHSSPMSLHVLRLSWGTAWHTRSAWQTNRQDEETRGGKERRGGRGGGGDSCFILKLAQWRVHVNENALTLPLSSSLLSLNLSFSLFLSLPLSLLPSAFLIFTSPSYGLCPFWRQMHQGRFRVQSSIHYSYRSTKVLIKLYMANAADRPILDMFLPSQMSQWLDRTVRWGWGLMGDAGWLLCVDGFDLKIKENLPSLRGTWEQPTGLEKART